MKLARIFSLVLFGILLGAGFAVATGTPSLVFAGPVAVVGISYLQHKYAITNVLGINLTNITKVLLGGNNMGGIQETIYWGLWSDVKTWPTLPSNPANLTAVALATGTLAMKTGKYLQTIYSTGDNGELKFDPQGELDGVSFLGSLEILHPGMAKKILGFMSQMKNDNLFFIVKDAEGQMYLFGDSNFAAKMKTAASTTGKKTADRKGNTITFQWPCNCPIILENFNPASLLNQTSGSGS